MTRQQAINSLFKHYFTVAEVFDPSIGMAIKDHLLEVLFALGCNEEEIKLPWDATLKKEKI